MEKDVDFIFGYNAYDLYWFQLVGSEHRYIGFPTKAKLFDAVLEQIGGTGIINIISPKKPIKEPEFYSLLWDKE